MVRPQDSPTTTTTSDIAPGVVRDRGFISEEVVSTTPSPAYSGTSDSLLRYSRPSYFWGSVIAGALLVYSIFCLSYLLMLGCHVGVNADGMLALGWGAAIWFCVTSCIAYYFGGMLATCISAPIRSGWLKGSTVWGLSVPLALVISAVIAGGSGLFGGLNMPHFAGTMATTASNAQQVANNLQPHIGLNFGYIWTAFIALALGLVFSIFGSASPVTGRYVVSDREVVAR